MMKNMNPMVPAALCLLCAAGLSACKDADVSTTAKTAGSVAEVQSQTAATTQRQTPSETAATSAEPEKKEADPTAISRSSERATTAREVNERQERSTAAREAARRPHVVTASPTIVDLGEMPTGDRRTGTVTLTNTSDTVVRLQSCRTSCGCTVTNCPSNYDMAPGESVEVDVTLSGGAVATRQSKTVNFIFEEHPNIVVTVTGDVIAYVTFEPRILDAETHKDGRIVVRSHDGEPFRVTEVAPAIIANLPAEAATEHELFISWDQWTELRQPRRLEISLDHPMTQSVTAAIRPATRTVAERTPSTREARQPARLPLHELAQRGEMDALMARLSDGEDVDSADQRGYSLLSVAARHGHVDLMQALLEAGANVNLPGVNDGLTPLMNAAQSKNVETVRVLLEAGADVNARDITLGNTALSWAALSGNPATVKALLDAGAEVEVVARITGYTPLTWASGFGETGSVSLLLAAGADPEVACQVQGATPVMYAASTGRVDNVKALLERGVNLDAKDLRGRTVLVFAAGHSGADAETIKALIDAGANVQAVDPRGMNALDHARTRGDARKDEVIALLQPFFEE